MTVAQFQAKVDGLTDANEWRAAEPAPKNVNDTYERSFSPLDRLAVWVTDHVGSMGFLMPLIMVGQNLQDRYAELRAEADFLRRIERLEHGSASAS